MENVKPWQIVLIVVAFAALGFSLFKFGFGFGSSIPQTDGYMTVDIMTGQLYDIRKGKAKGVPLPAKNPDTGVRTLYPANHVDGLIWEIPQGYDSFLTENVRKGSKLGGNGFTIEVVSEDSIRIVLK